MSFQGNEPGFFKVKGNCFFVNRLYVDYQFAVETCKEVFNDVDFISSGRLYEPKDHGIAQEVFVKAFEVLSFDEKPQEFWIGVHDTTSKGVSKIKIKIKHHRLFTDKYLFSLLFYFYTTAEKPVNIPCT